MSHRRTAVRVIAAALTLDALLGWAYAAVQHLPAWHGLYVALADAVTVGGDVEPTKPLGYAISAAICVTVVPLFAATFSLFTSALAAVHVRASEKAITEGVEKQLAAHHEAITEHHARHLDKLATDVGNLADATRAVLEHARGKTGGQA